MNLKVFFSGLSIATFLLISSLSPFATANQSEKKQVFVYNWTDYIAPKTNANFTKTTGIKVIYDVYDSNSVLESKLFSGQSGYDIVSPSHNFLAPQIKAGVYAPLDKNLIPNLKNLDPQAMALLAKNIDTDNSYSIPYTWGTTGVAYNVDKIKKILGKEAPTDSWALVYDPNIMKKLYDNNCPVGFIDAPTEVYPSVIKYLHPEKSFDPNNATLADYKAAQKQLLKVRPYITYFNSSKIVSDLANGDICAAVAWSGDAVQGRNRAIEAKNNVKVIYYIPKEGANSWFDMLAVPTSAPHKKEAMAYINYILDPKVSADIVNHIGYASANDAAKPYIHKPILNDPALYPDSKISERLFLFKPLPRNMNRRITRLWISLKSGR